MIVLILRHVVDGLSLSTIIVPTDIKFYFQTVRQSDMLVAY